MSWQEPRINDLKSSTKGDPKLPTSTFVFVQKLTRDNQSSYLIPVFPLGIVGRENRGPGYINSVEKKNYIHSPTQVL